MSEAERNASYRGGYDAGYTKGNEDGYNAALRAQEQKDNDTLFSTIKSIVVGEDERLLSCPLCGEPLIKRTTTFSDGNPDLHTAYCHCGFCFSEDGDLEDFIAHCNRRAQEQNEPLTCDGCAHEHCEAPEIENYCCICKRSHQYSDRYEPKGADQ